MEFTLREAIEEQIYGALKDCKLPIKIVRVPKVRDWIIENGSVQTCDRVPQFRFAVQMGNAYIIYDR